MSKNPAPEAKGSPRLAALDERHLILLFHTTHETMHAESLLKAARMRFKVVPRPRSIKDDCGLALVVLKDDRGKAEGCFEPERVYPKAAFHPTKDGTWIREEYPSAPISYDSPPSASPSPSASSWD